MKKIFPYMLMFLIFANLFAPLSVEVGKNNTPQINAKIAEASGITITMNATAIDTEITAKVKVVWEDTSWLSRERVTVMLYNATGTKIQEKDVDLTDAIGGGQEGSATFSGLTPSTQYKVTSFAFQASREWWQLGSSTTTAPQFSVSGKPTPEFITLTTQPTGIKTPTATDNGTGTQKSVNIDSIMPECGIGDSWLTGGGTVYGCAAQLIYYVLFVPTSYLFALAGQFFDWSFGYSVDDDSYRSPFVLNGWGLVRDFCNIFFIFVLLYVAFSTILSIHGFKTKEMIINVVIIGLLINFSLFASQVIIDASNILARVFYNSNTIKITEGGANGVTDTTPSLKPGLSGELPISAAIVNKINPQNLIINGATAIELEDTVSGKKGYASKPTTGGSTGAIGAGAFILITLLAIGVNVIGLIVFFSVGLIFIARVIGLWLAMIFVPLAFFSYTVPQMQDMKMVGWKHWWPETLKLAFLAPIFIFFLYLILQFLDTGLGLIDTANKTGAAFVIGTTVPFIFIMVLLWQAKSIAKDLSGTIGQSITGAVATVGGLALGGAALGGALLGRKMIGSTIARASRGDTATQRYEQGTAKGFAKVTGFVGSKIGLGKAFGRKDPNTGVVTGGVGGLLNKKQKHVGDIDHARHEMDTLKDKAGLKGIENNRLSGVDMQKLQKTHTKEKKGEIEADLRSGNAPLIDPNGNNLGAIGESGYKARERNNVSGAVTNAPNARANGDTDNRGALTDAGKKKVEDQLNVQFNAILKTSIEKESTTRFSHLQEESKQKVSGVDRIIAQSNKGSYDVRNLSQTKVDKREGMFTKTSAALIAGIAMGVRTGLKTSGINHGSGQNDFFKDIGHTITEALKSAKFDVKIEESHGKSSDGDSHGGGGHH